ncbi:MAG TPA: PEP-CTERM sorting domain-containing protein [Pyrinomonadaceae bacterium]
MLTTAATIAMFALSSVARADSVGFGPGQFGSTATVSNYSLSGNTFTFTLTNTSSTGSITGVGFNLPGTNRGAFTLTTTSDSDFKLANEVKAQAGGQQVTSTYDFALLTGKNFGGGNVAQGLNSGQSGTFTISGNFSGLTAEQIARAIALRFQGINPGDQSEVIGANPGAVPEPMTMLLFGTGLAGVAARARRRRASKA